MDRIHLQVITAKFCGQRLHAIVGDPSDHESVDSRLASNPTGNLRTNAVSRTHHDGCTGCHLACAIH